jgi:hypothetical protein
MGGVYEVISLYYDKYENIMVDQDGEPVFDIFRMITPSLFYLYKKRQGTYYIKSKDRKDVVYEFVFPLDGDEDEEY